MATRLGIGREETDKEFAEKDRKFTIMVLHEALKDNEVVKSYSEEKEKTGGFK